MHTHCDYLTVKTLVDLGYTANDKTLESATQYISSDTARIVELLLDKANANPNERNRSGVTILSRLMAQSDSYKESIPWLRNARAVIKVLRDHGATK